MIITIDDTFYIDKDEYNYTLKESKHKKDKKGNDVFVTHGYFSTLDKAINRLKHIKVESSVSKASIYEYTNMIQKQHDELIKLLKDVD